MLEVVDRVLAGPQYSLPGVGVGDYVTFSFADDRYVGSERRHLDNHLHVGVNASSGYGGLAWWVTPKRAVAEGTETAQWCWVSDNPNPPSTNPLVLSDPNSPILYDPRSTLPVDEVRSALEEFCRSGTGGRPECISWVHGEINGERLD